MARKRASESDEEVEAIRDPEYYDDDGNCVIRVENVLFKVRGTFTVLNCNAGRVADASHFSYSGLRSSLPHVSVAPGRAPSGRYKR